MLYINIEAASEEEVKYLEERAQNVADIEREAHRNPEKMRSINADISHSLYRTTEWLKLRPHLLIKNFGCCANERNGSFHRELSSLLQKPKAPKAK